MKSQLSRLASEGFRVGSMASAMAISERQRQHKLKAQIGKSPLHHLRLFRLRRSLKLLAEGRRVGEVAYEVGFASPAHFAS